MARLDCRRVHAAVAFFKRRQAEGVFPGGQLVMRCHGHLVVDEAVGLARGYRPHETTTAEAQPSTPFLVHSSGKPVVALLVAILEDRGIIDINAPVAEIWPEFGANGKAAITTLDILTHRGGVVMPELLRDWRRWHDWPTMLSAIEDAAPSHPRGRLAYHPLEYGWILAEIVQRATGTPWDDCVRHYVSEPAGLPHLGFGRCQRPLAGFANAYWLGAGPAMVAGRDLAEDFEAVRNSAAFFDSLVPGGGLVTDAGTLAAFYDIHLADGVTHCGKRLLRSEILRCYQRREVVGWDPSTRAPLAVGRGLLFGTWYPSPYGWWGTGECYGHTGAFATVAFADPATKLSVAIVTNGNRSPIELVRLCAPIGTALRKASRSLPRRAKQPP